jgi:diphosphomevalonate decarboxylase
MTSATATAAASPNIALIKYWGNRDDALRIPANDSLSFTLSRLETRTQVVFSDDLADDRLIINGSEAEELSRARASSLLKHVRELSGCRSFAQIESETNFPTAAGLASSAAAFAALALAASTAAGLDLQARELSCLARLGSGSAARSIYSGFALLHAGEDHQSSFAEQLFPVSHWPLIDLIAVVESDSKSVGSTSGHQLANSSPLQDARIRDTPRRLDRTRQAIAARDIEALGTICELDSNMMHAVMLTSAPPLLYWSPGSIGLMHRIQRWRAAGDPVFYTIDAGPNVHCITVPEFAGVLEARLSEDAAIEQIFQAPMGEGARLLSN